MAPEAPREQEQSIKARKREIFEEEHHQSDLPRRPFSEYVARTPPTPLSAGQKVVLGAVAALVVLLLVAALLTIPGPKGRPRSASEAPAAPGGGR